MIKTGGHAFPRPFSTVDWGAAQGTPIYDQEGMTYRQWLVGQILPALINSTAFENTLRTYQKQHEMVVIDDVIRHIVAEEAHKIANAVIECQEKEPL